MKPTPPLAVRAFLSLLLLGAQCATTASAQIGQDQAADMLLNSARESSNEKNYPFAVTKYREFLAKHGSHKESPAARYELGVALLESPERPYQEARDVLQAAAHDNNFADRHLARYYLAVAARNQGLKDLADADSRPNEPTPQRASAQKRFEEAVPLFAAALADFETRAKSAKAGGPESEWAARARCDLAELQLRLGRAKEARETAAPFVSDKVLSSSRCRDQGRYCHGFACLLLHDPVAAQKSLSLLAPFADPAFGGHARYLLARAHHLEDERPDAAAFYEAAVADYQKSREEAAKELKQPDRFKGDPEERARLEALVRNPAPDYVGRAKFYIGVLQYEAGKFGEAKARFLEFLKQTPQSPLRNDAELRLGFCHVQLKEFADAIRVLTPVRDRDPRLADQATFWIGKAQAGQAPDPAANPQGHQQALQGAIGTLRQAAERAAHSHAAEDPQALTRRGEILMEVADQLQHVKQYREAAALYQKLLDEKALPDRPEELAQRQTVALSLAGEYGEADKACERFLAKYPQSTLRPAVLFTHAENSYFRGLAAEKTPGSADGKDLARIRDETAARYLKLIATCPESPKVNVARYSLGLAYYRQGEMEKAQKVLGEIPAPERGGDLAPASLLMADCLLRQVPRETPEDALAAGKMEEQLKTAAELLEGFVGAQPKNPQAPDALLKYGLAQQRLATLMAQPAEKAKAIQAARATYERLIREYAGNPAVPQAALERAKCFALAGDPNTAAQKLQRFVTEPVFKNSPVAPMALVQMATYYRTLNRPQEAVAVLEQARKQYEDALAKDPARSGWVALLRYHHGLALRESGKQSEARGVFDSVVKLAPDRPEGIEASLRLGQCLKDEGGQKLEQARKLRATGRKEDLAGAAKAEEEGLAKLREAVAALTGRADAVKKVESSSDVRARLLYEAAWTLRALADSEVETARAAQTREAAKKLGQAASKLSPPDVPLDKIPLQPSEKRARDVYKSLIDEFAELPIATEARFELAELLAQRHEVEPAVQLLTDVLDKEPAPELTEKVRLRLGAVQAAKGNLKAALVQFDAVAANPKSPLAPWAHYQAGEVLLQGQQVPQAVKRLAVFRDQPALHNVPGLTDRALLRLGQALALQKQWDQSRQALERLVQTFPQSRWADEARYGIGWSLQQQHNHEGAVNTYNQVTARTVAEVGAKAQLQIGLCRLEQKRYQDAATALLVVPFTYDYPELSAAALLEAARAYDGLNRVDESRRLLGRLVREYPETPWAEEARERLGAKR